MKKLIWILIVLINILTFCNAQRIESKKSFIGYIYTQNGTNLSPSELSNTLKKNTKSFQLLNKAKTKGVFSAILFGFGGGAIGYPIGTKIGGGEPNWTSAWVGVGCLAIAVPIVISGDKNMKQAIENYNDSLNVTTSNQPKPQINIIANVHGFGLVLNF